MGGCVGLTASLYTGVRKNLSRRFLYRTRAMKVHNWMPQSPKKDFVKLNPEECISSSLRISLFLLICFVSVPLFYSHLSVSSFIIFFLLFLFVPLFLIYQIAIHIIFLPVFPLLIFLVSQLPLFFYFLIFS